MRVASCSSECAVTSVASRSMSTCRFWTGAPAMLHTRSRPRRIDRRDGVVGVGSQAGDQPQHRRIRGPNTAGCARSTAISAAASPPRATAIARSATILPESCVADGGRHCPSSRDNPPDRPLRRAVSINNTPPACDTSDSPPAITDNQGRKSLCSAREVPLNSVRVRSRQPRSNRVDHALSRIRGPRVTYKINLGESPRLTKESLRQDSGPPPRTRHAYQDHTEPVLSSGMSGSGDTPMECR